MRFARHRDYHASFCEGIAIAVLDSSFCVVILSRVGGQDRIEAIAESDCRESVRAEANAAMWLFGRLHKLTDRIKTRPETEHHISVRGRLVCVRGPRVLRA